MVNFLDSDKLWEYTKYYTAPFAFSILIMLAISFIFAEYMISILKAQGEKRNEKYQEMNIRIGVIRTIVVLITGGIVLSKLVVSSE